MPEEVERLLIAELRVANRHVARQRRSLEELLREEHPSVLLMDGTRHYFRRSELRDLASRLGPELSKELRLPIVLVSRPDMGEGAVVVEDPVAARAVARLLGVEYREPMILYRPHLAALRSMYDTVFQVVVSTSLVPAPAEQRERY